MHNKDRNTFTENLGLAAHSCLLSSEETDFISQFDMDGGLM